MRIQVPTSATLRAGDVTISDLTGSTQIGPPVWVGETTLAIPFDVEPTAAEQALIRRRLLTRDAAHEARVTSLLNASQNLSSTEGMAAAIRLLLADALEGIEDVTAPSPSRVTVAATPSRNNK